MNNIICPNCGTETSNTYTRCTKCGYNFFEYYDEYDEDDGYVMCPQCNSFITSDDGICNNCGYIFKRETSASEVLQTPNFLTLDNSIEEDGGFYSSTDTKYEKFNEQICPECGCPNDMRALECIECGYPFKPVKNVLSCPECGAVISDRCSTCPECGYPLNDGKSDNSVKKGSQINSDLRREDKKRVFLIGLIAGALSLIMLISGISSFVKSDYKDLKRKIDVYEGLNAEYQGSYDEMKAEADRYAGGMFKNSYNNLAMSYRNLQYQVEEDIENCKKDISKIIIRTVFIILIAAMLFVLSCIKLYSQKGIYYVITNKRNLKISNNNVKGAAQVSASFLQFNDEFSPNIAQQLKPTRNRSRKRKKIIRLICIIVPIVIVFSIGTVFIVRHISKRNGNLQVSSGKSDSTYSNTSSYTNNDKSDSEKLVDAALQIDSDMSFKYYSEYRDIPTVDSSVNGTYLISSSGGEYEYYLGSLESDATDKLRAYAMVLFSVDGIELESTGSSAASYIILNGKTIGVMGAYELDSGGYGMLVGFK